MSKLNKALVIGDVLKWEMPNELCRIMKRIKRVANATVGLVVGEIMEPATAVAQVATIATGSDAPTADGGTYKLGYKGQWTTDLAWNADAAAIKAAFELLSTVDDTITASAAFANGTTITWGTAGKKDEIDLDARLLTDGGVAMTSSSISTSTVGSTADDMVVVATGGNASGILLEEVTLEDLQKDNDIERAFLVKGPSVVNGDNLYCASAQLASAKTALETLGITIRYEPDIYQSGPVTE